jgi:hypothetical protein
MKNFCNIPNKILINDSNKYYKKTKIESFFKDNSNIKDDKEIELLFFDHYSDLFGKPENVNNENYKFTINSINDQELKDNLNSDISYEEAFNVIKNMKSSSPGPNGLTLRFYKKFFPFFGQNLVQMLNNIKHDIAKNFRDSIIKFIPKNDKKDKSINDYRPISITNYEYRIFTKILTNRLVQLNDKIFKNYQFRSIKGKIINSIIHMTRDMILDLFIMSIGQNKAFDNIDHSYLFNLLKHVKIG